MKKLILIALPLMLIAGAVVGLGITGTVQIPGLSPPKKKVDYSQQKPIPKMFAALVSMGKKLPKPTVKAPVVQPNDTAGEKKLASLWSQMEPTKVAEIVATWNENDVAPILNRMKEDQVAKLVAAMEPERAAAVCQALKKLLQVAPKT